MKFHNCHYPRCLTFFWKMANDLLTGRGQIGDFLYVDESHQFNPLLSFTWLVPADLEVGASGLAANCLINLTMCN